VLVRTGTFTGPDGRFELEGLSEAPVSVAVEAERYHRRIVTLPRTRTEVEVALRPVAADQEPATDLVGIGAVVNRNEDGLVLGNLVTSGGAAAAGLHPGDVVLRIDGQPIGETRLHRGHLPPARGGGHGGAARGAPDGRNHRHRGRRTPADQLLVPRPGCREHAETAETEARRRTPGTSSGGVPRGSESGRPAPLRRSASLPWCGGRRAAEARVCRVAARGSAVEAFSTPGSRHSRARRAG
jgi:hypothetical protein